MPETDRKSCRELFHTVSFFNKRLHVLTQWPGGLSISPAGWRVCFYHLQELQVRECPALLPRFIDAALTGMVWLQLGVGEASLAVNREPARPFDPSLWPEKP